MPKGFYTFRIFSLIPLKAPFELRLFFLLKSLPSVLYCLFASKVPSYFYFRNLRVLCINPLLTFSVFIVLSLSYWLSASATAHLIYHIGFPMSTGFFQTFCNFFIFTLYICFYSAYLLTTFTGSPAINAAIFFSSSLTSLCLVSRPFHPI